jgi:transaldolase/glucose-6-phosphate isomerase
VSSLEPAELVDRIWARDPTVWTGHDEASWLGWLDEPARMLERLDELDRLDRDFDHIVLLGMGGSSLAPEVLRRTFAAPSFRVLDTTHPAAIRRLEAELDLERTLFVAASKSGTTLETRCQLDYFLERGGTFAAITDPGTKLEQLARERGFAWIVAGEPTIGGRYSALSPFGMVPAALMDLDVRALLERADAMAQWCRLGDDNPGFELGEQLGGSWADGMDKVCFEDTPGGFGLWAEQLLAESTGKGGKGLVPAPGELPDGSDRQAARVRLDDPYDIGAEFFRWEFATAVAGAIMAINPFVQPDVQAAKDRTSAIIESGGDVGLEPEGSLDELLDQSGSGDYVAILAFIDPARGGALEPLIDRARESGCVVTHGVGPRYLHSTGQLHKGGPNSVLALQVVDDLGDELKIPGRKFGFRRLIAAQAAGDYEALKERGRRVARVRLDEL